MLPNKLYSKLTTTLEQTRTQNLLRQVKNLDYLDAGHALGSNGQKYLVLASNNYLGLTFQPEVIQAAQAALVHGSGSTGARLTTGASSKLQELEQLLASFKKTQAALFYNTGYMANVGVISALADSKDIIFSDELNHASIIDGARLSKARIVVYKHSDMLDLQNKLREFAHNAANSFIVTDGVFSMDGDIANLPELVFLAEKYQACLIVDDAHSVGVLGTTGSGTAEHFHLSGRVPVQIGTLSKSLAGEGGYVAADKVIIDYLINKSRSFIFSTACSPINAAIVHTSLNYLINNPTILNKLRANTQTMRQALLQENLPLLEGNTPIIPIMIGEAALATKFSAQLAEQGILLSAIRPPTVEAGRSRLRLTVTAAHSSDELLQAAQTIGQTYRRLCLN